MIHHGKIGTSFVKTITLRTRYFSKAETIPEKEAGTTTKIAETGVRMTKAKRTINRPTYLKDFI